ncbi:sulfur carrier protein TtuD [Abditibacteriota bacterium]|nr:sulfur carrier protein TtuD [Abditibacteriota bacterium]
MKNQKSPIVSPEWLERHLEDPRVRVVQSDMTPDDYREGHIPGAVFWHSLADLLLPDLALNLEQSHFEELMSRSGIERDSILIFSSSYPATAPFLKWIADLFGHPDSRVLNGGSPRWKREGRRLETQRPEPSATTYRATPLDNSSRAFSSDICAAHSDPNTILIDARTPREFSGEWFMMAPPIEGQRAGHIEGAIHLPFELALHPNDTFKCADELRALYATHGITPDRDIITYCTLGARSAHTWFVLSQLLGFPSVRNYDGSWNEWSQRNDI